uniref:Predicted protein n=1 Tax=Hordeum vulgare subsp. vulgare TaxID=112509 RepID=F2DUN2_HORVV|nr:predicted protein [Hordeum vulgare subsp. vulgare]
MLTIWNWLNCLYLCFHINDHI